VADLRSDVNSRKVQRDHLILDTLCVLAVLAALVMWVRS
jgi:hypothetical protein